MSNYVDYDYYSGTFRGTLTQPEFEKYVIVAQSHVDRATNYSINAAALTDLHLSRIKNCICELVDTTGEMYQHSGISSESIGDMSVTYADTNLYHAQRTEEIIDRWLGDLFGRKYDWV